jgi:hypothetical protein
MKTGTKSLLFGCHQFVLHPIFVLWAWIKLYDWPNWKELICIIIHDWGYWGCGNMDDKNGENHPWFAAVWAREFLDTVNTSRYFWLCLLHSRFLAKRAGNQPSKLCWADKLGTALMPVWLWVCLGTLSGEINEYINDIKYKSYNLDNSSKFKFFKSYQKYVYNLIILPKKVKN